MTNAEKFEEVFGFEPEKDHATCDERCEFYEDKPTDRTEDEEIYCDECRWNFWQSEYQGEPTIPLSVIEKIHDAIDNAECDARLEDENGSFTEEVFTREHITEIIDKAVKEKRNDT